MGIVRFGAPTELMLRVAARYRVDTFVETGTFRGETSLWAAKHFAQVITVENSQLLYSETAPKFKTTPNVEFRFGDSRVELKSIVPSLKSPAIIWLDSHFCGSGSYGEEDQCPLLEELRILNQSEAEHFIFIDDARLFLSPPPSPSNIDSWPTIAAVCELLNGGNHKRYVVVCEDVIIAVPWQAKSSVADWCQRVNTEAWQAHKEQLKEMYRSPIARGAEQVAFGGSLLLHGVRGQLKIRTRAKRIWRRVAGPPQRRVEGNDLDRTLPIVFWCYRTGLANRLRALCGYQALAALTGVPFMLCWEANHECDAAFDHLFEADESVRLISTAEKNALTASNRANVYDATPDFKTIWTANLKDAVPWEAFQQVALRYLRGLRPRPEIQEAVNAFSAAQHNLHDAVGLHVRMTDNLASYAHWAKHSPIFDPKCISKLEGFEQFVQDNLAANPRQRFFLATDNEEVERILVGRFAGAMLVFPKAYRSPTMRAFSLRRLRFETREQRVSSIQDALTEFLLLARCKEIVGTYYSSYGELAAIMGGVKEYVVTGNTYSENLHAAELGNRPQWAGNELSRY